MTDKILIVTAPDDILVDGLRILHVDLSEEQSRAVSSAMLSLTETSSIINYVWKISDPVDWLLDKRLKSDLILFNADTGNQTVAGYMAAQPNSYYFGNLKDLHIANNRAIYSVEDVLILLEKVSQNYETR